MRYFTDSEIEKLVTTEEAIACLEQAFIAFARREAAVQPRLRTEAGGVKLSTLGAVMPTLGYAGAKIYTTIGGRFSFAIILFRTGDGAPVAVMDGNALTKIRTGAVSAVAARRLAAPDASVLTIFGSGVQAHAHALAIPLVRPIREIRVVSRSEPREFIAFIRQHTGLPAASMEAARALDGAGIVVTATRSKTPLFNGELLTPGCFVAAIGSSLPDTRELDDRAMRRAERIVVEWLEQARAEAGDLRLADKAGAIDWNKVTELGSVLTEANAPRRGSDAIMIFKSVGFGLEDVALAALAFRKASGTAS
jgi:ornithine cyclodeaminase